MKMDLISFFEVNTLENLKDAALNVLSYIKPPNIIILKGEMGAGKTTFVRLLCSELGIENITSPTFSVVNYYIGKENIYHLDFYRIERTEELYDIGIDELLNDLKTVKLIEWGNKFYNIFDRIDYEFVFEINNNRYLRIYKYD